MTNYNFSSKFKPANILSIILFVLSVIFIAFKGLNYGIDFKGGILIENKSTDDIEIINNAEPPQAQSDDWQSGFSQWLGEIYQSNSENMLEIIEPALDKVMIDFALEITGGKKQEAAKVLGLGRNTLSKKIKAQQT